MDPRLLAHYDGDLARVNIASAARTRLLRRYPATGPSTASKA
jgi:hypothetical protein